MKHPVDLSSYRDFGTLLFAAITCRRLFSYQSGQPLRTFLYIIDPRSPNVMPPASIQVYSAHQKQFCFNNL